MARRFNRNAFRRRRACVRNRPNVNGAINADNAVDFGEMNSFVQC